MEQHEYIRRRSGGGPVHRPSRRNGPPRFVWILLILAVVVGVVALVILLSRGSDEEGAESSSPEPSMVESMSPESASSEPVSQSEPTPSASGVLPEQLYPDSAPMDEGGIMIAGGHGYEYYHFNEENTNNFILAVDNIAKTLSSASLYTIVVPTGMDVTLQESYLLDNSVDSSDQRKAIDSYIYPSVTSMNSSVKTVPTFTPLREHCNEYIYFNSDRTWTQLGAYYVYSSFCASKGISPASLDSFTKREYEGFYGGLANLIESDALYSDTVEAYMPGGDTSLSFTDSDGVENDGWAVIADGDGYDSSLLYLIFTAGDQPYKVLENDSLPDGPTCVVVQDSFGNYFTPFLTQHYSRVYVVDYRTYSYSVPELISETGAQDVILLTSVLATSESSTSESLNSIF